MKFLFFFLFVLSFDAFSIDVFGQWPFLQEEGPYGLRYIVPNELDSYLFDTVLENRKGGVFIGVGTFRVLNESSGGHFDHVFFLDHDGEVGDFNRAHNEIILESQDRHTYLANLFGRDAADLVGQARVGRISDLTFLSKLESTPKKKKLSKAEKTILKILPPTHLNLLLFRIRQMLGREEQAQATIFGSDLRFHRVRKQIEEKRMTVITGSLAGTQSMSSISEAMHSSGKKISVLDLSNAHEHLSDMHQGLPSKVPQFLRNLKALPFAKDGIILFTADEGEEFTYYSVPHREFIELVENGGLNLKRNAYAKLIGQLSEKYRDREKFNLVQLGECVSTLLKIQRKSGK